jgi:pyridoxamine 5'-phosphate oxidase family protein
MLMHREDQPMVSFTDAELRYLTGERRLGRLATIDADGLPHVVPLGWSYNEVLGTIDISGRNFAETKKFRNVKGNGKAALIIDDVLPPWRPRAVMVQGLAEALSAEDTSSHALIRLTPTRIISWGLEASDD